LFEQEFNNIASYKNVKIFYCKDDEDDDDDSYDNDEYNNDCYYDSLH